MRLEDVFLRTLGKVAVLFKYEPNSSNPMSIYQGQCLEFDALGYTIDDDNITVFDEVSKTNYHQISISDFIWAFCKPKRKRDTCNEIIFAVGTDEYCMTYGG